MIRDYLVIIYRNLATRKLRAFLTVLGIVIGISAIVALVSITQGMTQSITEQFEILGADKIAVQPGSGLGPVGPPIAAAAELTERDIEIIEEARGVDLVAGLISKSALVKFRKQSEFLFVQGAPPKEASELFVELVGIESGRTLRDGDKFKALVGNDLAHDDTVFGKTIGVGDKITIEDEEFEVVGVLKPIGNRPDDTSVIMPLETAREVFEEPEEVQFIIAKIRPGADIDEVAEDIKESLRKDREQEEGEEDFTVTTGAELVESFTIILRLIQTVLVGIAAIALLVGGIGIMNSMYTSVLERTREIGIMKAIGARNSDISLIFLIESGVLGLVGGAIGVAIGIGIAKVVEIFGSQIVGVSLQAFVTPTLILGSLGFSFGVGVISGALPSIRAAKLKPVEALRYE